MKLKTLGMGNAKVITSGKKKAVKTKSDFKLKNT